jgi:MSHA pilin protein MshC
VAGILKGPKGDTPASITAKSGVTYTSTLTDFYFDGLGQPITTAGAGAAALTQTIQVANVAKSITVETATGYVHE